MDSVLRNVKHLACVVIALAAVLVPGRQAFADYERVGDFGDNPGTLLMYRYAPVAVPEGPRPLVVAMHGCGQNAFGHRSAGWEAIADAHGFYVIYPEQPMINNQASCFNSAGEFGDPTNIVRGEGENRSIISMIERMEADYDIDPGRIFATGFAAGGAQAALMLATWPDVFAAGASVAGIPYHCTTDFFQVSTCLTPGIPREPDVWGNHVREAFPEYEGPWPRMSVWQGTRDIVVSQNNAVALTQQWTNVHGTDQTADVVEDVNGHSHSIYHNADGEPVVETWEIDSGGHGVFIDSASGCGGPSGMFAFDVGLCSSMEIARFFGILGDGVPLVDPDEEAPVPPTDDAPPAEENGEDGEDGPLDNPEANVEDTPIDEIPVDDIDSPVGDPADTPSHPADDEVDVDSGVDTDANAGVNDSLEPPSSDTSCEDPTGACDEETPVETWVSILTPERGDVLSDVVAVEIEAGGTTPLQHVVLFIDDDAIATDEEAPYLFEWDTSSTEAGLHQIKVRAYDINGVDAVDAVDVEVAAQPEVEPEAPGPQIAPPSQPQVSPGTEAPTTEPEPEFSGSPPPLRGCTAAPAGRVPAGSGILLFAAGTLLVFLRRRRT